MPDVLERDAGFCSAEEDDDGIHSPTDASEDSVDVKVQAISLRNKNKRKCAEPRRVDTDLPAKKRKLELAEGVKVLRATSPFRPWSCSPPPQPSAETPRLPLPPFPPPRYLDTHQDEPLSLVSKKRTDADYASKDSRLRPEPSGSGASWHTPTGEGPSRAKPHRAKKSDSEKKQKTSERVKLKPEDVSRDNKFRIDSLLSSPGSSDVGSVPAAECYKSKSSPGGGQQRNYKNMTRERRIEANARERTRVHTISAAFDTLRHAIPAYSHNQKLSKLSVLRIACSYIMTLSRLAGEDYSHDQSEPEVADCVDVVSKTIQTEGKIRKKKED